MAVIGYLFAAAGYQYVGIGKEIYDRTWDMRQFYDRVEKKNSGFKINKLAFMGPKEELLQEDNGVIINAAYQSGIFEVLKKQKINPEQMAAYKSGEISMLVNSGVFTFEDGLNFLFRKQLLSGQEIKREAFVSILVNAVPAEQSGQVVAEINKKIKAEIVSHNFKDSVTVTCETKIKDNLKAVFVKMGGTVLDLPGEELCNFSLLQGVAEKLKAEFKDLKFEKPLHKLVSQSKGEYYENTAEVKETYTDYLWKPCRLDAMAAVMIKNAVNTFVEIGCGTFLGRMMRKADSGKRILSTHDFTSLGNTVKLAN